MADDQELNFERMPDDGPLDETDVSLRAYFARLTDEHIARYDPTWTDDRVVEWDGNFRCDGVLMLTCCERDVDVTEYRQVLERHLDYRRKSLAGIMRS
jgi:hypothetical protein